MNIYGDTGNVLVLARRLEWRGIEVRLKQFGVGQAVPSDIDILVAGGGQDKGQLDVAADLHDKKHDLMVMAADGVTMLLVCGTYQLFGHRFVTGANDEIKGIGIFDMETFAAQGRMIGNINIKTDFGELVGYENHSGETYLGKKDTPLGTVLSGSGNNGVDFTEGAIHNNVFGTYLHGPVLPKNPTLADELLTRALSRKYGEITLEPLNDKLEHQAQESAFKRSR